jgi:hypothetical protein
LSGTYVPKTDLTLTGGTAAQSNKVPLLDGGGKISNTMLKTTLTGGVATKADFIPVLDSNGFLSHSLLQTISRAANPAATGADKFVITSGTGKIDNSLIALPGVLTLIGTVDPTVPNSVPTTPPPVLGDTYVVNTAGIVDNAWGAPAAGQDAKVGDLLIRIQNEWELVSSTGNLAFLPLAGGIITGNLGVNGATSLNGNVALGDANTDTLTINAGVSSDILPDADGSRSIGNNTLRWDGKFDNFTAFGASSFYGDLAIGDAATDLVVVKAEVNSNLIPHTDNAYSLGSASKRWASLYANYITADATTMLNGDVNLGSDNTDLLFVKAEVNSNFIPHTDNAYSLGSGTKRWASLYANYITADATVMMNGNVILGSDNTDTVTFNGLVNSNLIPDADGTRALGSASARWDGYFDNLTADGNSVFNANVALGDAATDTLTVNATATFKAPVTMSGALTVDGAATLNANVTLGDSATDITTVNSVMAFQPGTAAAPSIYFKGSPTTGFYQVTSDRIGIAVKGQRAAQFDEDGNFQIFGPNGLYTLLYGGAGAGVIYANLDGVKSAYRVYKNGVLTGDFLVSQEGFAINGQPILQFGILSPATGDSDEKMRILNDGKIGIGTTTPQAKLDVAGDVFIEQEGVRLEAGTRRMRVVQATTIDSSHAGAAISATTNINVAPLDTGDLVTVFNADTGSPHNLVAAGVTMYLAGDATAAASLVIDPVGLATIFYFSASKVIVTGQGVHK